MASIIVAVVAAVLVIWAARFMAVTTTIGGEAARTCEGA